jgi:CxxC motif-containing protein (DUF1111 family)
LTAFEGFPVRKLSLHQQQKWFAVGLTVVLGLGVAWHFSSGLPVIWGPSARASTKQAGYELFVRTWQPNDSAAHGDGLGPVFNDLSCVACHNQGGVGGGGDNSHNVNTFSVLPNARDGEFQQGTIHANASDASFAESFDLVRSRFPVIKGGVRTEGHCSYTIPDVDPLRTQTVQTTALFGAGWIDRISPKAISRNRRSNLISGALREFNLDFDTMPAGRTRVLPDGRIGKFGWKAQFATLDEFVAAACANELGLGTPKGEQARSLARPEYVVEESDLDRKQFKALVAFVGTLPRPVEVDLGDARAGHGKQLFSNVGCAVCHVPDMGGVKGVYSDFLLHRIVDQNAGGGSSYGPPGRDMPLPPDQPHPDEWKTPPLWGVADSAPYMHDGSANTLEAAISRHGGDAQVVRDAFRKLSVEDQVALVAFLKTLKAPSNAIPVAAR